MLNWKDLGFLMNAKQRLERKTKICFNNKFPFLKTPIKMQIKN